MTTEDLKDQIPAPVEVDSAQFLADKIIALETSLANTRHDLTVIMGLMAKLGEMFEANLKTRQVDGGTLFYWEKAGRILMPN